MLLIWVPTAEFMAVKLLLKGRLKKQFKMLDNYCYRYPDFRKYSYSQHLFLS